MIFKKASVAPIERSAVSQGIEKKSFIDNSFEKPESNKDILIRELKEQADHYSQSDSAYKQGIGEGFFRAYNLATSYLRS